MAIIELIGPTGVGKSYLLKKTIGNSRSPLLHIQKYPPRRQAPIQFRIFDERLLSLAHRRLAHQHNGNGNAIDFFHRLSIYFSKIGWDASIRSDFAHVNLVDDDPVTHLFLLEVVALAEDERLIYDFLKNRRLVFIYDQPAEILRKLRLRAASQYRATNGFSDAALVDLIINPYLTAMAKMETVLNRMDLDFHKLCLTEDTDENREQLQDILGRAIARPIINGFK